MEGEQSTETATDGSQLSEMLPEGNTSEPESAESQPVAKPTKPAGYYPVPLDGLPEEFRKPLEARFGYFMRQIGEQNRTLGEYRTVASTQAQKIEELLGGMGQVVDHLQTKGFAETEAQITQEMLRAHESGDNAAWLAANNKMIELKTEKRLQEAAKRKPEQRPTATDVRVSPGSEISGQDYSVIEAWQNETDPSGTPLRPWAHSSGERDTLYRSAEAEAKSVFNNVRFANWTVEQKLAEVDRRMGLSKNTSSQTVMGGQLTNGRKTRTLTLSPDAEKLAVRTKFAGPKKSDAEHIAAYRAQLEKVNGLKGARK